MPLALIKGRNAIDRGEIREEETERRRLRRREREKVAGLTSVIRLLCAAITEDKSGTRSSSLHTSNDKLTKPTHGSIACQGLLQFIF